GDLIPGLKEVFPDQEIIDRTWINAWEDPKLKEAVLATGRRQIVIAGLWTEMCVAFPAVSALEEGREVFVVADASGGATLEAHDRAMDRMVAKGAVPLTTQVVLGEFQRDWGRPATYAGATAVAKKYFGNWGQVLDYYAQAVGGPVSGHGKV
ncbi:isochorismatase family protein, partial [Streptomyces sp. NPDC000880]